jgi:formylglycine-generating enzyme required for sulfatase activity
MGALLAAFISAGFIVALELATYWLVGFSVALTIFVAVVAGVASGTVFSAFRRRPKIAILISLIPTTALPLAALLVWGVLVFQGVRAVEAEMQFARIPAGCFSMGNPVFDGTYGGGRPAHKVCVKNTFDLGIYEVTQAQWRRVMIYPNDPEPADPRLPRDRLIGLKGDRLPVNTVSWDEAARFARLMSFFGRRQYRLPTEAEWEYTARAGTTTRYWWGDEDADACANENIADLTYTRAHIFGGPPSPPFPKQFVECDDGFAYPAPVGSLRPNPWGLYDMLGNVSEWVQDCWEFSYDNAPTDGSAVTTVTTGSCNSRVVRGGNFQQRPVRVFDRNNNYAARVPTYTGPTNGLRLARIAD